MLANKSRLISLVFALCALAGTALALPPGGQPASNASDVTLESAELRASVSRRNTGLTHVVMKDPRYPRDGQAIELITTDKPAFLPMRPTFARAHPTQARSCPRASPA